MKPWQGESPSTSMEKFATLIAGGSALVMTVATAMLGFTIPSIWTLQSDMGAAKATLANIDKRLESIEKKLDGLDGKADVIAKRADAIELRLAARDTDPATILAASGLRPATEFYGVRVADRVIAMPKTDSAAAELESLGAKRVPVTPSSFGYLIGKIDQSGLFISANSTGSTEPTGPAGVKAPR